MTVACSSTPSHRHNLQDPECQAVRRALARSKVLPALLLLAGCLTAQAQTKPATQLLPPETQAFFSIPNAESSRTAWTLSPGYKAWSDPAFSHVRKTGTARFDVSVAGWVEQATGMNLGETLSLAEGQITLAWIGNPWPDPHATNVSGWVFLLDAGANAPRLRSLWHATARSLASNRPQVFTTNYAETEFLIIPPPSQLNSASLLPPPTPENPQSPANATAATPDATADCVWIGLVDDLLLAARGQAPLRAVLDRHRASTHATLATSPAFLQSGNTPTQPTPALHGWIHLQAFTRQYLAHLAAQPKPPSHGNVLLPSVPRLFQGIGIPALRSLAFAGFASSNGLNLRAHLALPEADRKGLFTAFRLTDGSTAALPFAPTNATRFHRWRLDGPRAWAGIERLLSDISPPLSGVLDLSLNALGKDQDANFDFRQSFAQSLGDDWIYLETPASTAATPPDPPERVFLIGTTRPEDLQKGVIAAASLLPAADARDQIRQTVVAGHKIKSLPLESLGPEATGLALHFTTSGNYVAFTTSLTALTNLIQRTITNTPPASTTGPLKWLEQQLGNTEGGIFAYENLAATWTALADATRNPDPDSWAYNIPGNWMSRLATLLGPDTLPAQAIARHLPISATRIRSTPAGFDATLFLPARATLEPPP